MAKILIAEDDPNMGRLLVENLRLSGYEPTLVADGSEAKRLFALSAFDLCILDVMMPRKDGFQLATELRAIDPRAAFIFLSAKNTQRDKKEGFQRGCDDYMTKPFDFEELLLRVNAVLDRTMGPRVEKEAVLQFGGFSLDLRERALSFKGKRSLLTEKESRLLQILALNIGRTVTRTELLTRVWGKDDPYHSKSMDVYLTRIRKHLRSDERVVLHNVHGRGYRLEAV